MDSDPLRFVRIQVDQLDPGPLPVPFHDSTMGPFTHWKLHWLRLTADDGVVGQAPCGDPGPLLTDVLLGEGPGPLGQWMHRLYWMRRNDGHRSPATSGLLFALDLAMRDILAQRAKLPLHRYLGAQGDSVPAYGSGGGTNLSDEELVAEMQSLADDGFCTLKMKVGSDFGRDMQRDAARVALVRAALGPNISLAIDGNQCWDADQAMSFARKVADLGLAWFEEPVHSADRQAIAQISRTCPFPVAMGESENHAAGFRDLAQARVPHLQPNPHCLPGYAAWRQALDHSLAATSVWTCGGMSHLTAVQVASVNDGRRPLGTVEYLRSIIGHLATCFAVKPAIAGGRIELPADRPGLPVAIDWKGLEKRTAVQNVLDRCA